ncbi:Oligopeptide-binding protein AppA precursor [Pirellulimonas nuda]|uniref:Oligopeptide-binding protein AppA n=1 Tax=Pirellulimonas nuda TaxID=2528009 RepID=A0A518D5T7_9BACT|nr:ABC transporter substrate-binding protein [Pirellulimonas nuda]QDU86830.1 Oligopeptide-binding protein AppA precursor [Pirellulimonas nuda]
MLRFPCLVLLVVATCLSIAGCGGPAAPPAGDAATDSTASGDGTAGSEPAGDADAAADQPSGPFVLGDLLDKFDPPPLAEIDESAGWIDRPVLDGEARMRELLAEDGPPELTAEQALKLRNDSPENNAKIAAAMGRLAPEDGRGIDYDATVVRHVTGDLKSSNPVMASSVTEAEFGSLTGIGLITFDRNFDYFAIKGSVAAWQTSQDRLMDKIVMRDDLTWSDGKPITAHDVEFTFKVIMSSAVPIPAVRQGTDLLKYVKAYDDHTLVFFHKESLATNTPNMLFPIIPKHAYADTLADDPMMTRSKQHSALEDAPVVGGPYKLTKRVRNQEFVLERRDDYFTHNGKQVRPKPYVKRVRVKVIEDSNTALLALKEGDIDEMQLRAEEWVNKTSGDDFYKRNTKVSGTEWTEFHFLWNLESQYFSDKRVRQAMAYAVDYDELMKTVCLGLYEQSRGNYHPASWMFPKDGPTPYKQDLDKAEDLLAEAGWTDSDGDGVLDKEIDGRRVPFRFTLLTYQTESGRQAATLMKNCLDQIGVICDVKPMEFTVLVQQATDHKFDGMMGGWGAGADPATNRNIFGTGQNRNYGQYSNPEVDKLFDAGEREFDPEKRAEIYGKIHNILWEDQPYTWLFYRNGFFAFNKKLRGYNFSPRGPYSYSPGFESIFVPAAAP